MNILTLIVRGTLSLLSDSAKILFGAGQDASIRFDGTNWIFNSREVGTGDYKLNGGDVDIEANASVGGTFDATGKITGTTALLKSGNDKDTGPILKFEGNASDQVESGRIRFAENLLYTGLYIHFNGAANSLAIGRHAAGDSLTENDIPVMTFTRNSSDVALAGGATFGSGVGAWGHALPASQPAAIPDPTDLPTAITQIIALRDALAACGVIATS